MCCNYKDQLSDEVRTQLQKGDNCFYKVWEISDTALFRADCDPIIKTIYKNEPLHINDRNEIFSDRKTKDVTDAEQLKGEINYGIHVFRDSAFARRTANCSINRFIVPVYGELEDFVAADSTSVVFIKIKVKKEDLIKALGEVFDFRTDFIREKLNEVLERAYEEPVPA